MRTVATRHGGDWAADPSARHRLRYCDEDGWSDFVADGVTLERDPEGARTIRKRYTISSIWTLVLGFTGAVAATNLIPAIWFVSYPCAVGAIALGIGARRFAPARDGHGAKVPGLRTVGIVLGVVALTINFIWSLLIVYLLSHSGL